MEGGEPAHAPSRSPALTGWAAQAGNRHLVLPRSELKASTEEGALCLSAAMATRENTHSLARLEEGHEHQKSGQLGRSHAPLGDSCSLSVRFSFVRDAVHGDTPIPLPVE